MRAGKRRPRPSQRHMEIYQLRYLVGVAEALNYTKAANTLHVSQSALSRQIIQLEKELGVRLFDRNRQRVSLTDDGRVVLAHAEKILAEVSALTAAAKDLSEGRGGEVILSCNWRVFFGFIPETVAEFRRRYPQSEIRLREVPIAEQASALHSRKVHIGFLPSEFLDNEPEFERLRVLISDLVVVVSRQHRLARRRSIELRECTGETWLTNDAMPKAYPAFIRQYCRKAGFSPIFGKQGTSIEELLGMIAAGYGITMLPRYVLTKHQGISSVRLLKTDCAPIELCAVWLRTNKSRLLQQYLAILRDHIPQ